jgi:hypothetical protein
MVDPERLGIYRIDLDQEQRQPSLNIVDVAIAIANSTGETVWWLVFLQQHPSRQGPNGTKG